MTALDLFRDSLGNLWRMKLRTFLTISGVVIAIAAFVAMVSFGAGMQQNVSKQFNELGLFSTMLVWPSGESRASDTTHKESLDWAAIEKLAAIEGVNLAYPFDEIEVTIATADTALTSTAQALPSAAVRTKLFSNLSAGEPFASDSASEILIDTDLAEKLGFPEPDSAVGHTVIVSVSVASLDSAMAAVLRGVGRTIGDRMRNLERDSIVSKEYWQTLARDELGKAVRRFSEGYFGAHAVITDTLTITGVLKARNSRRMRLRPIIVPAAIARRFTASGLPTDPAQLISLLRSGSMFIDSDRDSRSFPQVTLDINQSVPAGQIKDSVEALGFRAFSYAEEFDEIRRFLVYLNLALAAVGLIALLTAALGIVNTMIMSILERRREIGVLKSLGADDRDIRLMYLVESGAIGLIGSIVGLGFGWLITRIALIVAQTIMEREGIPVIDLFALPAWLVLSALLFGTVVSVVAGLYPAARAARLDPVIALRDE